MSDNNCNLLSEHKKQQNIIIIIIIIIIKHLIQKGMWGGEDKIKEEEKLLTD